jgi:hypothetical protein
MKKVTLYTNKQGFDLFNHEIKFCASAERFRETDLEFTVDEDDIEFYCMDEDMNVALYDVFYFDSVEWIK